MTYLIDTDWLINALTDRGAARDVLEAFSDRGLAVSIISLAELYAGIVGRPDETASVRVIARFLRTYDLLGLTESIMLTFSRIRAHLNAQGQPLPNFDLLIAATAIDTNRVLITRNRRHFDRVPGLQIY